MKRKRVKCDECGTRYRAKALRCPICESPNPAAAGGPGEYDRTVGILLILIGIGTAIPVGALLIGSVWMGGSRGIRSAAAGLLLSVIPIGCMFHGMLFLCGIHPREFYAWWDNLPPQVRGLAWFMLAILVVTFVIVFFLSEPGQLD